MTVRTIIAGAVGVGAAAVVLTACGSSTSSGGQTAAPTSESSSMSSSMSSSQSSSQSSMSSMPSSKSSSMSSSGMSKTSAGTATVTGGKITIDTTDQLRFMPSTIKVAKPGKVTVTLTNSGSYPHNIEVPSLGATSGTVSGNPGQQKTTVTFNFTKAGKYPFVCTFHEQAGMKGTFVVG